MSETPSMSVGDDPTIPPLGGGWKFLMAILLRCTCRSGRFSGVSKTENKGITRVSIKKSIRFKKSIQFSGGGAPQPSVAFTDDPSMVLQ